jgi:hypothetical protein
MAVDLHLSCKRRVGSKLANQYLDICHGFHITFYETLQENGRDLQSYERWKTGNLYELPAAFSVEPNPDASDGIRDGDVFRQSAFTVSSLSLDKSNK